MADCPGVLHLAAMADGGLARIRTPGGRLTSAQARAVADASRTLGSGALDLTNRANLQIRGLAAEAGPLLVAALARVGLPAEGDADRRRNILVDPYSGLDPAETLDMLPLAATLDEALKQAPWIGALSPKFSFVLDGGGRAGVSSVSSDVSVLAEGDGFIICAGEAALTVRDERAALGLMIELAHAATTIGPDARGREIDILALGRERTVRRPPRTLALQFGAVRTSDPSRVALTLPVPVGRLSAEMLGWLADLADEAGEGRLVLAPWSAVVVPGVAVDAATGLLSRSVSAGFTPVAVVERLRVIACAGEPACERAREPAKMLGAALLDLAAAEPSRLPPTRLTVHLSACRKGCAGSAPADLLLLGSSERRGWSLHRAGSPRAPGRALDDLSEAAPADILARLSAAH